MGISRRKYLGSVGALGAVALAGCNAPSGGGGSGGDSTTRVAWPSVTSEKLDDWKRTGRRRRQFESTGGVQPSARTHIYDNETLRRSMEEKTVGAFDQSLATFFATHINLEGFTARFASMDAVAAPVFENFRAEMEANDITNIEEVSLSNPQPAYDSPSRHIEYRGEYVTPAMSQSVTIDGAGERTLDIPSQRLRVTGIAAVWKENTNTWFAAGGAFPAEDYETTNGFSVSGDGEGDGIDIQVAIDLNIRPDRLHQDIVDLAESVTKSNETG